MNQIDGTNVDRASPRFEVRRSSTALTLLLLSFLGIIDQHVIPMVQANDEHLIGIGNEGFGSRNKGKSGEKADAIVNAHALLQVSVNILLKGPLEWVRSDDDIYLLQSEDAAMEEALHSRTWTVRIEEVRTSSTDPRHTLVGMERELSLDWQSRVQPTKHLNQHNSIQQFKKNNDDECQEKHVYCRWGHTSTSFLIELDDHEDARMSLDRRIGQSQKEIQQKPCKDRKCYEPLMPRSIQRTLIVTLSEMRIAQQDTGQMVLTRRLATLPAERKQSKHTLQPDGSLVNYLKLQESIEKEQRQLNPVIKVHLQATTSVMLHHPSQLPSTKKSGSLPALERSGQSLPDIAFVHSERKWSASRVIAFIIFTLFLIATMRLRVLRKRLRDQEAESQIPPELFQDTPGSEDPLVFESEGSLNQQYDQGRAELLGADIHNDSGMECSVVGGDSDEEVDDGSSDTTTNHDDVTKDDSIEGFENDEPGNNRKKKDEISIQSDSFQHSDSEDEKPSMLEGLCGERRRVSFMEPIDNSASFNQQTVETDAHTNSLLYPDRVLEDNPYNHGNDDSTCSSEIVGQAEPTTQASTPKPPIEPSEMQTRSKPFSTSHLQELDDDKIMIKQALNTGKDIACTNTEMHSIQDFAQEVTNDNPIEASKSVKGVVSLSSVNSDLSNPNHIRGFLLDEKNSKRLEPVGDSADSPSKLLIPKCQHISVRLQEDMSSQPSPESPSVEATTDCNPRNSSLAMEAVNPSKEKEQISSMNSRNSSFSEEGGSIKEYIPSIKIFNNQNDENPCAKKVRPNSMVTAALAHVQTNTTGTTLPSREDVSESNSGILETNLTVSPRTAFREGEGTLKTTRSETSPCTINNETANRFPTSEDSNAQVKSPGLDMVEPLLIRQKEKSPQYLPSPCPPTQKLQRRLHHEAHLSQGSLGGSCQDFQGDDIIQFGEVLTQYSQEIGQNFTGSELDPDEYTPKDSASHQSSNVTDEASHTTQHSADSDETGNVRGNTCTQQHLRIEEGKHNPEEKEEELDDEFKPLENSKVVETTNGTGDCTQNAKIDQHDQREEIEEPDDRTRQLDVFKAADDLSSRSSSLENERINTGEDVFGLLPSPQNGIHSEESPTSKQMETKTHSEPPGSALLTEQATLVGTQQDSAELVASLSESESTVNKEGQIMQRQQKDNCEEPLEPSLKLTGGVIDSPTKAKNCLISSPRLLDNVPKDKYLHEEEESASSFQENVGFPADTQDLEGSKDRMDASLAGSSYVSTLPPDSDCKTDDDLDDNLSFAADIEVQATQRSPKVVIRSKQHPCAPRTNSKRPRPQDTETMLDELGLMTLRRRKRTGSTNLSPQSFDQIGSWELASPASHGTKPGNKNMSAKVRGKTESLMGFKISSSPQNTTTDRGLHITNFGRKRPRESDCRKSSMDVLASLPAPGSDSQGLLGRSYQRHQSRIVPEWVPSNRLQEASEQFASDKPWQLNSDGNKHDSEGFDIPKTFPRSVYRGKDTRAVHTGRTPKRTPKVRRVE